MDAATINAIVRSLLQRLDADANSASPQFGRFISSLERKALHELVQVAEVEDALTTGSDAQRVDPDNPTAKPGEDNPEVVEAPAGTMRNTVPGVLLDDTCFQYSAPQEDDFVLCLDFGTAKSKGFAASKPDPDDPDLEPEMVELGLGRRDADLDLSVYSLASSIWISDEGRMFAGSEAMRRSAEFVATDLPRRRLDSIKQQLTLANYQQKLDLMKLEPEINPTSTELSYEDALCFFLAFLTDMAGAELSARGHSRYLARRFTIPSWRPEQRQWAASILGRCVGRAQILADTFRGRWTEGIPAQEFKAVHTVAKRHDDRLRYLIDSSQYTHGHFSDGLLEPLAAGSGRLWADRDTRNLVIVVDVGAGTTDFSLFWIVQSPKRSLRGAFQVEPCSDSIRMAGDIIDALLLDHIIDLAHGGSSEAIRKKLQTDLRLRSLRGLKERLFKSGVLEVPLVTDQIVKIEREEFERRPGVLAVASEIQKAIANFLRGVHPSWARATDGSRMVLTGGSAKLPMIQALAHQRWGIGADTFHFAPAADLPPLIAARFDSDFQQEYPQLAVAIGGALPVLDEKRTMTEWAGGTPPPGRLERYQVTGL
jgi:hypothetical protein